MEPGKRGRGILFTVPGSTHWLAQSKTSYVTLELALRTAAQEPHTVTCHYLTPPPQQEKAIVMRLTRIVYAFRNGHWPKPMEGLDLFVPRKQDIAMEALEESSEEEEEEMFNTPGDYADHTLGYEDEDDVSEEEFFEGDLLDESGEEYPEDSDSDFNVDVEEQSNQSWGSRDRPTRRQAPATQRLSTAVAKSPLGNVSFSVNKVGQCMTRRHWS